MSSFDEFNETRTRFLDEYQLQYQILIWYCLGYCGFSVLIFMYWRLYPLMEDERTPRGDLLAAIYSVFLLVGDYLTDALVMLVLVTSSTSLSDGTGLPDFGTISLESFTLVIIILSGSFVVVSTLILTYLGKHNEELNIWFLPIRFVFFATGLYPLYLLIEMVSVRIFGEARATLDDIVTLKYYHSRYEGIPQIALMLFLALSGVQDIDQLFLAISLGFSVVTLVSSLVMHDYLRDVGKDTYENDNDYNYLFYNEDLANTDNFEARREWIIKSIITRSLEVFGRISFYAIFALCTAGWGILLLLAADIIGLLYYHGYFFLFNVFWETINNIQDQGNVYIAWGEWKVKAVTTFFGYIIIASIAGGNPAIIALETTQNLAVFVCGIAANVLLFPWVLFLFRTQRMRGYGSTDVFAADDDEIYSF